MNEAEFLARLKPLARDPAARGLLDDAAVLSPPRDGRLVITHDMIVEGVHFLPDDPAGDVAWKLVAVNLSDLAAKGATPLGVLLGFPLGEDAWDAAFVEGLSEVLAEYDVPLLGGDTVKGPRVLGLTAIGQAEHAPSRAGANPGDTLYVTGTIGGAGLGLTTRGGKALQRYRRPQPRLAEGRALAPLVSAMMDISDGLLLDAQRMAAASGLALAIDLDAVPLFEGATLMDAVVAGDDYELLFAASPDRALPVAGTRIGRFSEGSGLTASRDGRAAVLPVSLGWLHGDVRSP